MTTGPASDFTLNSTKYTGQAGKILSLDAAGKLIPIAASTGSGDALSSAVSADNRVCRYDGTNNKTIQSSGITISDTNDLTGINSISSTLNSQFVGTGQLSLLASHNNTNNTTLSGASSFKYTM